MIRGARVFWSFSGIFRDRYGSRGSSTTRGGFGMIRDLQAQVFSAVLDNVVLATLLTLAPFVFMLKVHWPVGTFWFRRSETPPPIALGVQSPRKTGRADTRRDQGAMVPCRIRRPVWLGVSVAWWLLLGIVTTCPTADAQPPSDQQAAQAERAAAADPFGRGADPFGGADPPPAADRPAGRRANDPNVDEGEARWNERLNLPVSINAEETSLGQLVKEPAVARTQIVEEALRRKLETVVSVSFSSTPLVEVIQWASDQADVPMLLDVRAMADLGLTPDVTVTGELKDVSLRAALQELLRDLELTYTIRNELIQITTVETAESNLSVKVHALPEPLANRSKQVVEALVGSVRPDTWRDLGGPSHVYTIDNVLIVSTTESTHHEVDVFIGKVNAAFQKRTQSEVRE